MDRSELPVPDTKEVRTCSLWVASVLLVSGWCLVGLLGALGGTLVAIGYYTAERWRQRRRRRPR